MVLDALCELLPDCLTAGAGDTVFIAGEGKGETKGSGVGIVGGCRRTFWWNGEGGSDPGAHVSEFGVEALVWTVEIASQIHVVFHHGPSG